MTRSDRFPLTGGAVHSRPQRQPRQRPAPAADGHAAPQTDLSQTDLFTYVPPLRRTSLDPAEAPLLVVSHRAFSEADGQDAWLYLLVDAELGDNLLQNGLTLDPRAPLLLTERSALWMLFASQTEGPAEAPRLLLRVRRAHVAPWVEPDPDMSARLGAACYLLSRQTQAD